MISVSSCLCQFISKNMYILSPALPWSSLSLYSYLSLSVCVCVHVCRISSFSCCLSQFSRIKSCKMQCHPEILIAEIFFQPLYFLLNSFPIQSQDMNRHWNAQYKRERPACLCVYAEKSHIAVILQKRAVIVSLCKH